MSPILFEDHPASCSVGGWVGQWVNGWGQVKSSSSAVSLVQHSGQWVGWPSKTSLFRMGDVEDWQLFRSIKGVNCGLLVICGSLRATIGFGVGAFCLKILICGDTSLMGGCMGGWVDGWFCLPANLVRVIILYHGGLIQTTKIK